MKKEHFKPVCHIRLAKEFQINTPRYEEITRTLAESGLLSTKNLTSRNFIYKKERNIPFQNRFHKQDDACLARDVSTQ